MKNTKIIFIYIFIFCFFSCIDEKSLTPNFKLQLETKNLIADGNSLAKFKIVDGFNLKNKSLNITSNLKNIILYNSEGVILNSPSLKLLTDTTSFYLQIGQKVELYIIKAEIDNIGHLIDLKPEYSYPQNIFFTVSTDLSISKSATSIELAGFLKKQFGKVSEGIKVDFEAFQKDSLGTLKSAGGAFVNELESYSNASEGFKIKYLLDRDKINIKNKLIIVATAPKNSNNEFILKSIEFTLLDK